MAPAYCWPTWTVAVELSPGTWTDITADVVGEYGASITYGIPGGGPLDLVAGAGEFQCTLRNDGHRVGIPASRYSPRHVLARPGWTFGVALRVTLFYGGASYVKHYGKVTTIDPEPGTAQGQVCHIVSGDGMQDLLEASVRELALRIDADEATLITDVLDAVPASVQPLARSLDAGVERFPVAFHGVRAGSKAGALLHEILRSAGPGRAFLRGDGTFRYQSRITQQLQQTPLTDLNGTMRVFVAPSTLDECYNRVRITTRGQLVGTSLEVIYQTPSTSRIQVLGGATVEVWCAYTDPSDRQTAIGAYDVVDGTLTAPADYTATQEDGTGDLSAAVAVTLDAFASTSKATISNSGATTAYVSLSVRGKAVRDIGPATAEAFDPQAWDRLLAFEAPYLAGPSNAQAFADYYASVFAVNDRQIEAVEFLANHDPALMTAALAREPGDRIRLTEAVTGVHLIDAIIQAVDLAIGKGLTVTCRWTLTPAIDLGFSPFVLGTSALDGAEGLAL